MRGIVRRPVLRQPETPRLTFAIPGVSIASERSLAISGVWLDSTLGIALCYLLISAARHERVSAVIQTDTEQCTPGMV